jgi:hypothetical protein
MSEICKSYQRTNIVASNADNSGRHQPSNHIDETPLSGSFRQRRKSPAFMEQRLN